MASIVDIIVMFFILIFAVFRKICQMQKLRNETNQKISLNNFEKRGCAQIVYITKMYDALLCCYIFYFSQIEILKNILIKN